MSRAGYFLPASTSSSHRATFATVVLVGTVVAVALNAVVQGPGLSTVAQGAMSNIEEPRQVVVRTAAEWQATLETARERGHATRRRFQPIDGRGRVPRLTTDDGV